jgi:ceramide glucosyltransferase
MGDPALELAQHLAKLDPRIKVIEGDVSARGTNLKVGNLIQGYPHCSHPFIVCSDSDIAAPAEYMDKVMALFEDPKVGVVTSLYAIRRVQSTAVALESLAILDFSASVLVARALEGMSFGLGATLAFRREALQSIGAFEPLVDYLAEDFQLGHRIAKAGWKVKLSGVVVEDVVESMTFSEFVSHQLRWMRSYRISRPAGHFAFIITQGALWSSLICLIQGFHWSSLLALVLWWQIRIDSTGRNWKTLSGVDLRNWWGCLVFKDYLYLVLWVVSWIGNRVKWGSRELEILPDGTMRVV